MDNELPNDFELIVVGTGMIESIVAAAASRIGKNVLHIDRNDYYGGTWASFNIEGIEKYIINPEKLSREPLENINPFVKEGEHILAIGNDLCGISDVKHHWHVPKNIEKPVEIQKLKGEMEENLEDDKDNEIVDKSDIETVTENEETIKEVKKEEISEIGKDDSKWTQDKILKNCRKFNLDLAPKLQFSRGDFVELLISSNIARYSEYRSISRVLSWLNGQLEIVPCSRSDVFSNNKVSVVEKRMLMKLLSTCMENDETQFADYENKKFINYLKEKKLTPNLIHYVLYAIAMSTDDTLCLEAIRNTKRFLGSLGRFGKTPFLYSMYGSGELPQAFCRLCAVFGGIYCLNRTVSSLIIDSENKCQSVICGSQRITAQNFVMAVENVPSKFASTWKKQKISRAIFITDKSIMDCEKENLTLVLFPPEDGKNPITLIELGPATGTCPQGLFIVHAYCKQMLNSKEDLSHCVNKLLKTTERALETTEENCLPNVLWSLYYTATDTIDCSESNELPTNIYPCEGPDLDLDYDNAVKKAKDIFMTIYPNCEFLPRAPDPEEIIICDDGDEAKDDNDVPLGDSREVGDNTKEEIVKVTEKVEKENKDETECGDI